jgi:hypothetical protein
LVLRSIMYPSRVPVQYLQYVINFIHNVDDNFVEDNTTVAGLLYIDNHNEAAQAIMNMTTEQYVTYLMEIM